MSVEQQLRELLEGGGSVDEALALVARELDAVRAQLEPRPASELTPAERAALLFRAREVLEEMGDGSE